MDEELQIKFYDINTALINIGNQMIIPSGEEQRPVPVSCLGDFDYVKNYIYKLKADNKALNLLVDKLTAKEEKKDKWIKITTKYDGSVIIKTKDIDYVEHCDDKDAYELYLKGHNFHYLLRKESYEQLTELLVENKENE
jgi:hypothetical protein